jgi:hypothetical protein
MIKFMNASCRVRPMPRILAVLLMVCVLPVWIGSAATAAETNGVTATSILQDLDPHDGYRAQSATLLAFVAREDDRPWYADDALLVLQLPKDKWVLVHAVRNPKYPKGYRGGSGSTKWSMYDVMDAPYVGDRHFAHRPTRKEVDQFLKDNQWQFTSDKYMRVVRRVVDADAWQKVLGYQPAVPPLK